MAELLSLLTQGKLVRINRATFDVEPWLAERWESSPNGLSHTFHLRPGLTWSDGVPLTSADVVFSIEAAFDARVKSPMAEMLVAGGQPIRASAPDPQTVVVSFAGPSGPGVRLLDMLTVLPKHKLGQALAAGTLGEAWGSRTAPSEIVGSGPFVLRSYEPGQRLVLDRNPRYWRRAANGDALPYLDRLVLEIVPDQNAELIRLQSGAIDVTASAIGPDDYVPLRRAEEAGRVRLTELGVGTDVDTLWFCLKPEVKRKDPRFTFVARPEFRRALSHAVDREAFAQDVFLGEAVPVWGPITPGNRAWFTPNVPRYAYDVERARALLKSIGLEDRNGNGVVEDAAGTEARFTLITQRGITWYERGTTVLREQAAKAGIRFDVAPLEVGALVKQLQACDYDAIYYRPSFTDLDPAGNMDFWLSTGSGHFWNMSQTSTATEWERRVDTLMQEQAATLDADRRRVIFNDVQRILAENLPALQFAAPRLYVAHSARLVGVEPSVLRPPILWSADTLSVSTTLTAVTP
jgi:peptide/nickel transport system substrate-binding protein